jgi:hypothetical protein
VRNSWLICAISSAALELSVIGTSAAEAVATVPPR